MSSGNIDKSRKDGLLFSIYKKMWGKPKVIGRREYKKISENIFFFVFFLEGLERSADGNLKNPRLAEIFEKPRKVVFCRIFLRMSVGRMKVVDRQKKQQDVRKKTKIGRLGEVFGRTSLGRILEKKSTG